MKQNLKYKHLDNLILGHSCFIGFKIIQLISRFKKNPQEVQQKNTLSELSIYFVKEL